MTRDGSPPGSPPGAPADPATRPPAATPPAATPPEGPALDARLVPAALAAWLVAVAALALGWAAGAVLTGLAGLAVLVAGFRLRAPEPPRWVTVVVAAGACAGAVGVGATVQVHAVATHPLRAAGSAAVVADVVVAGDPMPVRGGFPGAAPRVMVPATLVGADVRGRHWTATGTVLVAAPAAGWEHLLPGQAVRLYADLAPPLRADLTVALLRTRGPPRSVAPAPSAQQAAGALRTGLRRAAHDELGPEPAALLPGLVDGDTTGLDPALQQDFRTAGLTHLTAVSGTNVAVVVGAVLLLARGVRLGPRTSALLAALALVGFVVLARPSPSVLRAAVMGGIAVLALATGRRRSVLPALAAAVVVLLALDPGLAVDPGFALSVLATGALVLMAPPLTAWLRARGAPPGVAEALAVPLAAHVVTAPVIAGLSGQVSLVAVVANLLAAPAVAPATVLGVLAALLAPWWTAGAHVAVWAAGPEVSWLVAVAHHSAAVPGGTLSWPDGVPGALLLAAVLGVALVALRWRRLRLVALAAALGLAVVLVPARISPPGWPPPNWAMVVCDVGQGDGIALATGVAGEAVLVDAGPDDAAMDGCLSRLGVRAVPLVVVSHLHADHVGGLAGALRGRSVGAVAVGPVHAPAATLDQVRSRAAAAGAPLVSVARGTQLRWPALELDAIGPDHPASWVDDSDGTEVNNTSVVLRARTAAGVVLLCGDAEADSQAALLASGDDVHADVLKVPHHGSRSSLPAFLVAVGARLAVISDGQGNVYGHPFPGTLAVLAGTGAAVRRTDQDGDVAVVPGPAVVVRGDPRPPPPGSRFRARGPGAPRRSTPAPWPSARPGAPPRPGS